MFRCLVETWTIYAGGMTTETVVAELFGRFPEMQAEWRAKVRSNGTHLPDVRVAFKSMLIPALEDALERGDLRKILTICAFLEDAAESARDDNGLEVVLKVEVGEWLGWAANEDRLSPWLGTETKRICGYVPGQATQRREQKMESGGNRWGSRVVAWLKRLFGR